MSSPASTYNLVLKEDDLALFSDSEDGFRVVTVEGTYDSDYGQNLPLRDQVGFYIEKPLITSLIVVE